LEEQHGPCDDWVFRLIKDHIDMGDKIQKISERLEVIERRLNILSVALERLSG
jgi:hypothetical protein